MLGGADTQLLSSVLRKSISLSAKIGFAGGTGSEKQPPHPFTLLAISAVLPLFPSKALTYPHTFMHAGPSKGYYQPQRMNFLDIYLNLFLERFNLPGTESRATDGARRIEDRKEEGEGSDRCDAHLYVYFTCQVMEFHSIVPYCSFVSLWLLLIVFNL